MIFAAMFFDAATIIAAVSLSPVADTPWLCCRALLSIIITSSTPRFEHFRHFPPSGLSFADDAADAMRHCQRYIFIAVYFHLHFHFIFAPR